ncbi:32343_t:CDS:1, partial [Racocetra persica]
LLKIHRFARRSERFMSAYKLGLSGKAADFAVKKYHSHRRIPEQVLEEFAHD